MFRYEELSTLRRLILFKKLIASGGIKVVSGAIASFVTKRAGKAISVLDSIEPIQDLHGYDKPWSGGNGKNLLNLDANVTVLSGVVSSAVTITSGDGSATITENYYNRDNNKFGWAFNVESNQTYTVSGKFTSSNHAIIKIYATDGSVVYEDIVLSSATTFSFSFNSDTNTTLYFYATISSWGQTITLNNLQIEKGSSATTYSPYSNICPISGRTEVVTSVSPTTSALDATTYTTDLGRTVYGGTLDVVSGVLTVDRGIITFDGTETWYGIATSEADRNRALLTGLDTATGSYNWNLIGNYITSTGGAGSYPQLWKANINPQGHLLVGIPKSITTVAEWQAYLAQNPLQLCYELATPQTIQLTPQEVALLKGTNNLWCDSGEIQVTYKG